MFRRMVSGSLLVLMLTSSHIADAKWKPKPPSTTLPGEMQGNWCSKSYTKGKQNILVRSGLRAGHTSGCPDKYLWVVWSNGLSKYGSRDNCTFTEIDKLDRYVYYVRGMCKAKYSPDHWKYMPNNGDLLHPPQDSTSVYEEVREIHLVDDALVLWRLPDV